MTRSNLVALALVALAPITAAAQQPPDASPRYRASSLPVCRSTVTADLIQCQAATLQEADEALNRSFQRLLRLVREVAPELLGPGADSLGASRLRAAERAWVAFRDAECASVASLADGSSATLAEGGCRQHLTEARTQQLDQRSRELEGRR